MPRGHYERATTPEEMQEIRMKNIKNHQFPKGVSGNPGGKFKMPEEGKRMMKEAACDAVGELIKAAQDPSDKNHFNAVVELMNRVYGKPVQPMDVNEESNVTHVIIDRHDDEEKPNLKVVEGKAKEG